MGKVHKSDAQIGQRTCNLVQVKSTDPNQEVKMWVLSSFSILNTIIFQFLSQTDAKCH